MDTKNKIMEYEMGKAGDAKEMKMADKTREKEWSQEEIMETGDMRRG